MKEFQKINLSGCDSLKNLPTVLGGLTVLREIYLSCCESLKELPSELGVLKELQKINLGNCRSLKKLPTVLSDLTALAPEDTGTVLEFPVDLVKGDTIDCSGCESLKKIPTELGALKELQKINLYMTVSRWRGFLSGSVVLLRY